MRQTLIDRYREYLPVSEKTPVVSLYEGSTPLIPAPRLSQAIAPNLTVFLKFEGMNRPGRSKIVE